MIFLLLATGHMYMIALPSRNTEDAPEQSSVHVCAPRWACKTVELPIVRNCFMYFQRKSCVHVNHVNMIYRERALKNCRIIDRRLLGIWHSFHPFQ